MNVNVQLYCKYMFNKKRDFFIIVPHFCVSILITKMSLNYSDGF